MEGRVGECGEDGHRRPRPKDRKEPRRWARLRLGLLLRSGPGCCPTAPGHRVAYAEPWAWPPPAQSSPLWPPPPSSAVGASPPRPLLPSPHWAPTPAKTSSWDSRSPRSPVHSERVPRPHPFVLCSPPTSPRPHLGPPPSQASPWSWFSLGGAAPRQLHPASHGPLTRNQPLRTLHVAETPCWGVLGARQGRKGRATPTFSSPPPHGLHTSCLPLTAAQTVPGPLDVATWSPCSVPVPLRCKGTPGCEGQSRQGRAPRPLHALLLGPSTHPTQPVGSKPSLAALPQTHPFTRPSSPPCPRLLADSFEAHPREPRWFEICRSQGSSQLPPQPVGEWGRPAERLARRWLWEALG